LKNEKYQDIIINKDKIISLKKNWSKARRFNKRADSSNVVQVAKAVKDHLTKT